LEVCTNQETVLVDGVSGLPYHTGQGLAGALASGCGEVAVFAAASETFSKRNINCSVADSLKWVRRRRRRWRHAHPRDPLPYRTQEQALAYGP
jgi:hypothetical protein